MALDIDLLRTSFNLVLEVNPNLTTRFYEILFERYPQARPLFGRNAQRAQERMLAEALMAVVDHLEDPAWLGQQLGALGAKHEGYGVTAEMYDWVGDALLATLAETAGSAWTPAHQAAWAEAYGAIVALMRAGVAQAAE
jgi:hemoglobin-like flavoprotein